LDRLDRHEPERGTRWPTRQRITIAALDQRRFTGRGRVVRTALLAVERTARMMGSMRRWHVVVMRFDRHRYRRSHGL
jgi:hypothetical protein